MSIILFLIISCLPVYSQSNYAESDYAKYIQSLIGGELEYSIKGGRIDLLTKEYAFEIERAQKWKESIGQSIWYALNTNKKAGIILILESEVEYKYAIQLHTALEYAKLNKEISVFLFPDDFKTLIEGK